MSIQPWVATCIQTLNHVVNDASSRAEAMQIVHRSLDRWDLFIRLAVGRSSGGPRNLVLFPEFALTGFPLQESAAEWIEKHLHRRQCLRARSSVAGPLFQLLLPDRPFRQRDPEMQAREYGQCAVAARFHGSLFRPLWRRGRVPGRQDRARQHRRDSLRRDHVSRGLSRADVP